MSSEYGNQLCQQVKITSKQFASIQEKQLEDKIRENEMAEQTDSLRTIRWQKCHQSWK